MMQPILANNNRVILIRKNSGLSFGEGKAHLYSDFDRTYLPSTHHGFKSISNASQAPKLADYFKNFRTFLNTTKEGFKFTITTGRNFAEFETMAEMARDRKFDMPLPNSLIVKNGSDEHTRIGTDEDFYKGGKLPFSYSVTNKKKEEDLKKLTNWDGVKIKNKLKELLQNYGCTIREYPTTNSANDYGSKSALAHQEVTTNLAILRDDGNLKIFYSILHEPDVEEADKVSQKIYSNLRNYLNKENILYGYQSQDKDRDFAELPTEILSPEFKENFPGEHGEKNLLTKLYDTQEAVKKAAKENDLVIVAGDSSNDFQMLNPIRYLSEYLDKDDDLCYLKDRPKDMIEEMDKNPELAKKFQELPFVGIVVKNNDKNNSKIDSLVKHFSEGKYKKIIVVEEGNLLDGVKQAIKMHAEANPLYKEKLSPDLKEEVLGIKRKAPQPPIPTPKPKGRTGWVVAGIAAVGGILGGIYLKNKKQTQERNVA